MRIRCRIDGSSGQTITREAVGAVIRLGGNPTCELRVEPLGAVGSAGIHARFEVGAEGVVIIPQGPECATFVNGAPLSWPSLVRAGDKVRLGPSGPTIELLELDPAALPATTFTSTPTSTTTPGSWIEQTVRPGARLRALLRGSEQTERFEIGGGGVIGRDPAVVQYHLDHAHVSRRHANLAVEGRRVVITDLGSSNGTFVNGRRLEAPCALVSGDRIDIGPFSLAFDGSALVSRSRSNNIELAARGLGRRVRDRATGRPLALLDGIDLVIRPREFICLLGPSGSGKTTLLAILSGRNPPTEGAVTVNGRDLYANFELLKEDIAVVPQRDVLHESLAVGEALRYTAELRLPPDLSRREIQASVSDILDVVGLTARRGASIRHLSGGQVKRASLANELVAGPSLLFLDEVTSGLDEQTDREVMELFRQVADGGKTVVCITHNLANVESTCHLVAILTEGGRLAFVGTPEEAKHYFGVARLGDVYRVLPARTPAQWHDAFRASPFYQRYVADRTLEEAPSTPPARARPAPQAPARRGASSLRQAWVLTRRYVAVWRGDWQALLALVGQGLLVAVLLGLVFGRLSAVEDPCDRLPPTFNLLLLMAVSCYWFGCNTAAKELVKERVIFLRERDFNLRVGAYFASKLLVLTLLASAQVALLYAIVRRWCEPAGAPAGHWAVLSALAAAGTAAGLLVSALARTEEVATALVPIVVIPQIILASVVAPVKQVARWLAEGLVSVYWGQKSLERLLPQDDLTAAGRETGPWATPLEVVFLQALVCVVVTVVALRLTGAKGRR
jgi:ABC-type multidrug transport system ATPase subunit